MSRHYFFRNPVVKGKGAVVKPANQQPSWQLKRNQLGLYVNGGADAAETTIELVKRFH